MSDFARELERLPGLSLEQRLTANRINELGATIEAEYAIAHARSCFSFFPHASPAACGTCVAIGTQIDATL